MLKDEDIFSFAGVWDIWSNGHEKIISCSIVTTPANTLVAKVHDRMPVILKRPQEKDWIGNIGIEGAKSLLLPFDAAEMKMYEISKLVNSPKNDSAEVIAELKEGKRLSEFSI